MMQEDGQKKIITSSKRSYSIAEKVFCFRCFDCCKEQTVITSGIRKQTLQRMIRNYVIHEDETTLYDPIKLMILIYLCEDTSIPQKHLERCRVNPNLGIDSYRTDLEFYIPQLCNYIVFHSELSPSYILEGMEKGSKLNFYFGHLYYFYMISLEKNISKTQMQVFKKVSRYRDEFLQNICRFYEGQTLCSIQLYGGYKVNMYPSEPELGYMIKTYGTKEEDIISSEKVIKPEDITLPKYTSIFSSTPEEYSFKSTLNFFEDLFTISQELKNAQNKKQALREALMTINEKLPACVYIPFTKKFFRLCNVLNIVAKESKIFSTKQRAPFYICIEVYNPAETLDPEQNDKFQEKVQTPLILAQNFRSESVFSRRKTLDKKHFGHKKTFYQRRSTQFQMHRERTQSIQTQILSQRDSRYMTNKLLQLSNQMQTQPRLHEDLSKIQMKTIASHKKMKSALENVFGENCEDMGERIRGKSIFGSFETWNLIHLIVKTQDNIKQEQFALQLIYQFDYIFKLEKLPLILTPYEVISMGPNCGIMEMVKDTITFDGLKKKLRTQFPKSTTLKQFFEMYYSNNLIKAKENFMKSLAAYSLVMYFLQVKDRHNGNILLHESGKIIHIDFGFFLSNLPGKGVELQKTCPFKLLSEYLDVIDGTDSYYFKKFRQYLFLGFKAARKHQNKILILAKMMYSSSGSTMPCFEKGEQAIQEMQDRFNPPEVSNDAQLNLHCQRLIDSSLDNWAAKWYDRWQYWAQGIFY